MHRNYIDGLEDELQNLYEVSRLILTPAQKDQWNLVKINLRKKRVSFLHYPQFDVKGHPELKQSISINLSVSPPTVRVIKGGGQILHRKELFVGKDYNYYLKFVELTNKEEELGLLNKNMYVGVPDSESLAFESWKYVSLASPGELRVYDSQNRFTGLINGEIREEIPNSVYDEEYKTVAIFSTDDTYRYEIVGTDTGTYGLEVASIEDCETTTFTATGILTGLGVIHDYTIDWDVLSTGEEGVTLQIDADCDGIFEHSLNADNELTHDEFILHTETVIDFNPDVFNLKSKGQFATVYIELPSGYDVGQIDVSTIMLDGEVSAELHPTEFGDYDNDGIPDLMVKFKRSEVCAILEVGEAVTITIKGRLNDGRWFEGTAVIRVIDD